MFKLTFDCPVCEKCIVISEQVDLHDIDGCRLIFTDHGVDICEECYDYRCYECSYQISGGYGCKKCNIITTCSTCNLEDYIENPKNDTSSVEKFCSHCDESCHHSGASSITHKTEDDHFCVLHGCSNVK